MPYQFTFLLTFGECASAFAAALTTRGIGGDAPVPFDPNAEQPAM